MFLRQFRECAVRFEMCFAQIVVAATESEWDVEKNVLVRFVFVVDGTLATESICLCVCFVGDMYDRSRSSFFD